MTTQQNGPRKIDVHLSLTRPLLMMGCEREPLIDLSDASPSR